MIIVEFDIRTQKYREVEVPDPEPVPEEAPPRADKHFAKGEYFYLDGQLCKAKASIANGAILTLNTNYEITSVENELSMLNE